MSEISARAQPMPRVATQPSQAQPLPGVTRAGPRPPEKPGFALVFGRRSGWYYRSVRTL